MTRQVLVDAEVLERRGVSVYEANAFLKSAGQEEYLCSLRQRGVEYLQGALRVSRNSAERLYDAADHFLLCSIYHVNGKAQIACLICSAKNRQIAFVPNFQSIPSLKIMSTAVVCVRCLGRPDMHHMLSIRLQNWKTRNLKEAQP